MFRNKAFKYSLRSAPEPEPEPVYIPEQQDIIFSIDPTPEPIASITAYPAPANNIEIQANINALEIFLPAFILIFVGVLFCYWIRKRRNARLYQPLIPK